MDREAQKRLAAQQAIGFVEDASIVGVGTGSTVAHFIDELGKIRHRIDAAVSSSDRSTALLQQAGIRVVDLNSAGELALYVDGADECDPHKRLIKGGGAALTREKILAAASRTFVCMIDASKRVDVLGRFRFAPRGRSGRARRRAPARRDALLVALSQERRERRAGAARRGRRPEPVDEEDLGPDRARVREPPASRRDPPAPCDAPRRPGRPDPVAA